MKYKQPFKFIPCRLVLKVAFDEETSRAEYVGKLPVK
jgi:hypothetical protein